MFLSRSQRLFYASILDINVFAFMSGLVFCSNQIFHLIWPEKKILWHMRSAFS